MYFTRQAVSSLFNHKWTIVRLCQTCRRQVLVEPPRKIPTNSTRQDNNGIERIKQGLGPKGKSFLFSFLFMTQINNNTADAEFQTASQLYLDFESQVNPDHIVTLMRLLGAKKVEAVMILKRYPQLGEIPEEIITQRISFLESKNITKDQIVNLSWILLSDSVFLDKSIKEIVTFLNVEYNCAVELLRIPGRMSWMEQVRVIWSNDREQLERQGCCPHKNRIECMAEVLECDAWLVSAIIAQVPRLGVYSVEQILILLEFYFRHVGFSYEEIINRSVVLQTSHFPGLWYLLYIFIPKFYDRIVYFLIVYVLCFAFFDRWF